MELNGKFKNWTFSPFEVISFGVTVATTVATTVALITWWAASNFQTKTDAAAVKQELDLKIQDLRNDADRIRASVEETRSNVSYIRGVLETGAKKAR